MPVEAETECEHCGESLKLPVPDSYHIRPTREDRLDTVRVDHRCPHCGRMNVIFWAH